MSRRRIVVVDDEKRDRTNGHGRVPPCGRRAGGARRRRGSCGKSRAGGAHPVVMRQRAENTGVRDGLPAKPWNFRPDVAETKRNTVSGVKQRRPASRCWLLA